MRVLDPLGISIVLAILLVAVGVSAEWLAPYDPFNTRMFRSLQPPNSVNLMGTDQLGRDIFSWVIYGIRTSLLVGLTSATLSIIIAISVGLLA
ncbi:MAG: hypothetical protein QXZ10_00850 [Sulfolobales archaeon]